MPRRTCGPGRRHRQDGNSRWHIGAGLEANNFSALGVEDQDFGEADGLPVMALCCQTLRSTTSSEGPSGTSLNWSSTQAQRSLSPRSKWPYGSRLGNRRVPSAGRHTCPPGDRRGDMGPSHISGGGGGLMFVLFEPNVRPKVVSEFRGGYVENLTTGQSTRLTRQNNV